ncbi:hypothetical protein BDB00DRAFT_772782 [Zychaea mexicana]|uniref:uncharacterized protein n=1 Tax=Zychaea mexicana TaxID=64656 RepID=UPI0022FE1ECF|nr:uncharacterized protein BDB00DRAFT_772782 [Zychaea mexicana]KAI9488321.1 hypothetical protein BDB00DRAFT_772782 [Zychaea mexicana]
MKGYLITELLKGPEQLVLRTDLPPEEPKQGEVQIQVIAAGLNFFDILQIQGKYQWKPPLPFIPGSEFAGVVLRSTVPEYKPGDRVFGSNHSLAQIITASPRQIQPIPKGMTYEQAAAFYITFPTSYAGLVVRGQLQAGEYCLVHAAGGGVGLAAVQIAKALGATVIATAGSAEKLAVAKANGADFIVNYRDKNWTEQVKQITRGHGADVVYDPVGLVEDSTRCIAWNGRIVVIGFAKGTFEKLPTNRILLKNISIVGLHFGAYTQFEPETIQSTWDGLYKLHAEGKLDPVVYPKSYSLETVPQAMNALASRETYGKVIVKVSEESNSTSKL